MEKNQLQPLLVVALYEERLQQLWEVCYANICLQNVLHKSIGDGLIRNVPEKMSYIRPTGTLLKSGQERIWSGDARGFNLPGEALEPISGDNDELSSGVPRTICFS